MKKTLKQEVEDAIERMLEKKEGNHIILMAHQNESGHAINISNAKLQYDKNIGFLAAYNPPNVLIKSPALLIKINAAKIANDSVGTIYQQGKIPLSTRLGLFEPLSKLVTRALGGLDGTEASDQLKHNAKTIADVIRGVHAPSAPVVPDGPEHISNSHMSFINRANNFRSFIALLAAISLYVPAETDLTIASMNGLLGQMDTANTNIGNTVVTPIENARTTRNHLLYDKGTGLIDLMMKAKKYVKSVFGASSAEFASVSKIKYTRPKK